MYTPLVLLLLAAVFNGTLAGASLDTSLVKLPARRRIGARAYAVFARGNDLGSGRWVYPAWAIAATLLVFAATVVGLVGHPGTGTTVALIVASAASVVHFGATSRAAPLMLGIRDAADDEGQLAARLDAFARWHALRAVFQLIAFLAAVCALLLEAGGART